MSDAEDLAFAVYRRASNLKWEYDREGGDFDKLEGRILDGVWSHEFDTTAAKLKWAERDLRDMADKIKSLRERFLANIPVAAE